MSTASHLDPIEEIIGRAPPPLPSDAVARIAAAVAADPRPAPDPSVEMPGAAWSVLDKINLRTPRGAVLPPLRDLGAELNMDRIKIGVALTFLADAGAIEIRYQPSPSIIAALALPLAGRPRPLPCASHIRLVGLERLGMDRTVWPGGSQEVP